MTDLINCQQPLTLLIACCLSLTLSDPLLFRLEHNGIGPQGARHLAQALEANSTLQRLGYVATALMTAFIIVSTR